MNPQRAALLRSRRQGVRSLEGVTAALNSNGHNGRQAEETMLDSQTEDTPDKTDLLQKEEQERWVFSYATFLVVPSSVTWLLRVSTW